MKTKWVSTDGWRGYYEPDPKYPWSLVTSFTAVNDVPSREMKYIRRVLKRLGYHYRSGWLRSSNVFSASFYLLVYAPKEADKELLRKIEELMIRFSNKTFSIFSGEEYPFQEEEFKSRLEALLA